MVGFAIGVLYAGHASDVVADGGEDIEIFSNHSSDRSFYGSIIFSNCIEGDHTRRDTGLENDLLLDTSSNSLDRLRHRVPPW